MQIEYILKESKPKDGKLLAIGHSMGGILLYAMLSRFGKILAVLLSINHIAYIVIICTLSEPKFEIFIHVRNQPLSFSARTKLAIRHFKI